jgi:MFS family permease
MTKPSETPGGHPLFALLRARRFGPLFVTQFLGAFNDNAYKNALVVLLTFSAASWTTMKIEVLANAAAGLFILPFFLFSATAGQLADKFDKARLARAAKLLEIAIVILAALGFWRQSLALLLAALFLLGLQSALFGPVKYAILPQHLAPNELIAGNALVEAGTFVAVLLGTLAGGLLAGLTGGVVWIVALCLTAALAGYLASRRIPEAPPPAPELALSVNPLRETWRCIGLARRERTVFLSILGLSWFWAYGALLLAQFPAYTKSILGGGEGLVTVLLAAFSIGIGAGSLACDRLTRRRARPVEPGLVSIGALGMALFGADLALATPGGAPGAMLPLAEAIGTHWRALADIALLGAFGGLYCVPLYALMQQQSEARFRARIVAANNILNALFMALAAAGASLYLDSGRAIPALFLLAAALHTAITAALFTLAPEFLTRALAWLGWRKEETTPKNRPIEPDPGSGPE